LKRLVYIWSLLLCFCFVNDTIAQANSQAKNKQKAKTEQQEVKRDLSDSKREEIQRYFGYEPLLIRYMTTPYDVTMNVNEGGNFLDVGFLYLIFLPILLLLFARKKYLVILGILAMVLLMVLSISNSYIYDAERVVRIENKSGKLMANPVMSFTKDPLGTTLFGLYKANNKVYKPLEKALTNFTGNKDYVTYPFMLICFGLGMFMFFAQSREKGLGSKTVLGTILLVYAFLWFMLSSGIIWYGYLMFLLALVSIVVMLHNSKSKDWAIQLVKKSFYVLAFAWIVICLFNRMSNINSQAPLENQGLAIYNPAFMGFAANTMNYSQTIENLHPNLSPAIEYMNKFPSSLVYRVGTSFTYFINKNNERVFLDNQLGFFNQLVKLYPEKTSLTKALKASNFRFLIVDLYTPTIDRTPEKTLTKKYNLLMNFLYDNQNMRLIGTDRVLRIEGDPKNTEFGVYGDILQNGSYAIFELI